MRTDFVDVNIKTVDYALPKHCIWGVCKAKWVADVKYASALYKLAASYSYMGIKLTSQDCRNAIVELDKELSKGS